MASTRKNPCQTACGLAKEFHLSSNYLVNASVRLRNTSAQSLMLSAQEWVFGTATPMARMTPSYSMNEGAMCSTAPRFRISRWDVFRLRVRLFSRAAAFGNIWPARTMSFGRALHNQFFRVDGDAKDRWRKSVARPGELPPFPNVEQARRAAAAGDPDALVYPTATLARTRRLNGKSSFLPAEGISPAGAGGHRGAVFKPSRPW